MLSGIIGTALAVFSGLWVFDKYKKGQEKAQDLQKVNKAKK